MSFLTGIWPKILAAGAIVLGILVAGLKAFQAAKQAGRDEFQRKASEQREQRRVEAKQDQSDVRRIGDDDLRDELRSDRDR